MVVVSPPPMFTPSCRAVTATGMLSLLAMLALSASLAVAPPASAALPDARAYELVSPPEENALAPYAAVPSVSGGAVDFQARGAFAGATSGSLSLYQASRTADGWQTAPLTPTPSSPLGALEEQVPLFYSPDLSQTIFTTPESYAPGDDDGGALNLYLHSPGGALTWLSQGSEGGSEPDEVTFDGATPDVGSVVFSTAESLLPAATPLETGLFPAPEYLYDRLVSGGGTQLIDVNSEGELLDSEGAVLGDGIHLTAGPPPASEYVPADVGGTTTNAISSDGSKVFFESPPPTAPGLVSLYMREDGDRTVLIAQSVPPEGAQAPEDVRFEGASVDGSLVLYTSAGALFEFNTSTLATVTIAPSVLGVTAISNDGSHVLFVSDSTLSANANSQGAVATEGEPNLYAYDTSTATTTFIATVAQSDVEGEGHAPAGLVAEPDIDRPAVPTPDGSVLVFAAHGNLTGQNPAERFMEIYRYSMAEEQLVCLSCTAHGVEPTGDASFGETAGGTYDPPGLSSPISANGQEVFFDTPDSLVPEDQNASAPPNPLTGGPSSIDVYEWEGGGVHLISCGCTASASTLQGTTSSGDDVLFTTTAKLVPETTGFTSLYDARVGGGFPPPPSAENPPCSAGCRNPFTEPPAFEAPASTTVQGQGNLPAAVSAKPKPLVCRKGYTKKRVKEKTVCVKKKAKRAARASVHHRATSR